MSTKNPTTTAKLLFVTIQTNDGVERAWWCDVARKLSGFGIATILSEDPPIDAPVLNITRTSFDGSPPESQGPARAQVTLGVVGRRHISQHAVIGVDAVGGPCGVDGYLFDDEVSPRILLPWARLALALGGRKDAMDSVHGSEVVAEEASDNGYQSEDNLPPGGDQIVNSQYLKVSDSNSKQPTDPAVHYLANSVHELRVPLTSMLGYVESLRDQTIDYLTEVQMIDALEANGRHLLELVDEVLLYSKIRTDYLDLSLQPCSPFELCQTITPILDSRAKERDNLFSVEFVLPLPETVLSDELRLRQLLLNLIGNAIKFTEHGTVSLVVSWDAESAHLLFDVVDTGIGIPEQAVKELFQPFHQAAIDVERHYGGSGLGLAICRSIAAALGGQLSLSSTVGQGSIFSFSCPCDRDSVGELAHTVPSLQRLKRSQEVGRLKGRVLVADDTAASREMLQCMLAKAGADVVTAVDGAQALERAAEQSFDLIVMDAEMPGVSGYEAIFRLRERGYSIPIVAVTAHLHRRDLHRCIEAGANQFVSKASPKDDILRAVSHYIGDTSDPISPFLGDLPLESPRVARASLKYLTRLERAIPLMHQAVSNRDWLQLRTIIHPLTPGEMFGFGIVTDALRGVAAALRQISQCEGELLAKTQYLEMVSRQLGTEREKLEKLCWDNETSLR